MTFRRNASANCNFRLIASGGFPLIFKAVIAFLGYVDTDMARHEVTQVQLQISKRSLTQFIGERGEDEGGTLLSGYTQPLTNVPGEMAQVGRLQLSGFDVGTQGLVIAILATGHLLDVLQKGSKTLLRQIPGCDVGNIFCRGHRQ